MAHDQNLMITTEDRHQMRTAFSNAVDAPYGGGSL